MSFTRECSTTQKMKFSITDFFRKCHKIRRKLHLLCSVHFKIKVTSNRQMSWLLQNTSQIKLSDTLGSLPPREIIRRSSPPRKLTQPQVLKISKTNSISPAGIYLFKVNNGNTRTMCEHVIDVVLVSLLLTLLTLLSLLLTYFTHRSGVSIVDFEKVNASWVL